ncbi:MAG: hypothetical protein RIB98_15300 [Acidimicrobiales bacterium]
MRPIDPTVVIERMAGRFRAGGTMNPVAAAVSVAARGHACLSLHDFAESIGLPVETVRSAELGAVAFGELPPAIGGRAGATGADLLALADLEATWRNDPPVRAAGR